MIASASLKMATSIVGLRGRRQLSVFANSIGRVERGADDARGIAVLGDLDRRLALEQGAVLVDNLAHSAPEDDQLRPNVRLEPCQVFVELIGPRLPAHSTPLTGSSRDARLSVTAVDLDVPELRIGHEPAVKEQPASDPGSDGQHQDGPVDIAAGAQPDFGQAGRVRIVDGINAASQGLADDLVGTGTDPRLVDVGGSHDLPALDHTGQAEADGDAVGDRSGAAHLGHDLDDRRGNGVGRGRLRRAHAHAAADQLARCHVDQGGLDARSAEVDAQPDGSFDVSHCA